MVCEMATGQNIGKKYGGMIMEKMEKQTPKTH